MARRTGGSRGGRKRSRSRSTKRAAPKKAAAPRRRRARRRKPSVVGKKWQVWKGTRQRTAGGLTKKDLRKSKSGKIVSKKQSLAARRRFRKGGISGWLRAVTAARRSLKLTGFVACKKGTKFYRTARRLYNRSRK